MAAKPYRFQLGDFECLLVTDGTFAYPNARELFFVNAPSDRLEPMLSKYNLGKEYVSAYPSLVVNAGSHRVLIDTGAGNLAPTTGKLMENLQSAGISSDDIDTVLLTHGHPDHIGGNVDKTGHPAFPNARYVMWKDEWEFWTTEPDISALKIDEHLRQNLLDWPRTCLPPIRDQLILIEAETEIVPGIRAIAAPGHTPGHMAISISSAGEQLLHLVDTVIHAIHVEQPGWTTATDLLPEQTIDTRHRLLDLAATEEMLVCAFHFPFPGLGHIGKHQQTWQWHSIVH